MPNLAAIILAAGEGTRMKSQTPKVLHTIAGRPMISWVISAVQAVKARPCAVVIGHRAKQVAEALPAGVQTAVQDRLLGTGHAVLAAQAGFKGYQGDILVLCGDAPLIQVQTLRRLVQAHRRQKAAATILTAVLAEPYGYGRILRDADDPRRVCKIVEERDASNAERAILEVNSGAYCFSAAELWRTLQRVGNRNSKCEYYLTDVIGLLCAEGKMVAGLSVDEPEEILGVNSRSQLADAEAVCNRRTLRRHLAAGVTVLDPAQTWIAPDVRIGPDTMILPGTRLTGRTVIGRRCVLGPGTHIDGCRIGDETEVKLSVLESSIVAGQVRIGPFSHLRPGTRVAQGVHIGNFAETNRSRLGPNVKVGHVSYLGDAVVGQGTNIGAGTITANYDGQQKHPTFIGRDAFIGSGTVIVAPSRVGQGAMTGAGAVLKRNTRIPPYTVAVGVPARVIKKRPPARRQESAK
jgi:bifunctional UDP-N-acetylglucosamine pyrophosphorylase/glucosamine-1-phosphate N-acetyltransferase